MLEKLIELSLRDRVAVLLGVAVLIAGGSCALTQLDIDAFPDTTPVMVQVNTTAPSLSPEEIERQITYSIEQSLSGLPSLENIRSVSKFGFSQVVVTFSEGTDIYFARQIVGQRLATVELPRNAGRPEMGPVSTGLGEVFHYVLTCPGVDFLTLPHEERVRLLTDLRTTHARVVLDVVEAIGNRSVADVFQGQLRFPLTIRLPDEYRHDAEAIESIPIMTPRGEQLPLGRLADVSVTRGPSQIAREWGQRRVTVSVNVRGRDVGSFVQQARREIASNVVMPSSRYRVEFGGQLEQMIRARHRLMIVVPIALVLIFALLYMTYGNVVDTLRVFTGIPFAWTGGIIALWLRDMPFSISAAVGFVALSGVAVLDDMLLVSTIRSLRKRGASLERAVEEASLTRLRPVLMTTLVAALGFVPMAFSTGIGAEVQRPLATVVIGGVIRAMLMSLLVLRILYLVFQSPLRHGSKVHKTFLARRNCKCVCFLE